MFEFSPTKTNKKAHKIIIILFAVSAALLVTSAILSGVPYIWTVQLVALILAMCAILLSSRYLAKNFVYRIYENGERTLDLTVTEKKSKKDSGVTVCRIALTSIISAELLEGKKKLRDYKKEGKPIFDYRPDIDPEKSILILSSEGGEETYICLAYNEELFAILSPYAASGEDGDENEE